MKFAYFSVSVNEFPVLKADGIKYIMIFRNQVSFSFTLIEKHIVGCYFILATPNLSHLAIY